MKSILKEKKMKILIVEDEIIPANYLKKVLLHEGYEILPIVDKGQEAIRVAKRDKPQIILMDVMLKDNISGCDAALAISEENPSILIVFLTAFSDNEMIDFAVKSKAFGYLLKPYRDKEILATLQLAKAQLNNPIPLKEHKKENEKLELVDEYSYDTSTETLFFKTQEVHCGPKALQLITLLCKQKKSTVKIEDILETLWDTVKPQQTLRSLIHRIREQTSPNLIVNVNKLGYKIGLKG
jgi:DNA-binding response OmpR family regulator